MTVNVIISQIMNEMWRMYTLNRCRDKGNNNINIFCLRARTYYDVGEKSLG